MSIMSSGSSLFGPLLFNIYVKDIFFFVDEAFLRNYANDIALYSIQKNNVSLTNLFLRKKLRIYKNAFMIITWY